MNTNHDKIVTTATSTTTTTTAVGNPTSKTLALLYPSGLMGGYRNQAIRYVSFVKHAIDNNITQLLEPSIVWSTILDPEHQYDDGGSGSAFRPIQMKDLFDIDHWNSYALKMKSTSSSSVQLPILVSSIDNSDCWHERSPIDLKDMEQQLKQQHRKSSTSLSSMTMKILKESTLLSPIYKESSDILLGNGDPMALRWLDLRSKVEHCQHPVVYGGGLRQGVLWQDYINLSNLQEEVQQKEKEIRQAEKEDKKYRPKKNLPKKKQEVLRGEEIISHIHQALQPASKWRQLSNQCIEHHLVKPRMKETTISSEATPTYIAVHSRIEADMLAHPCSKYMETNLTNILDMVDQFVNEYNSGGENEGQKVGGTFLAVSRGFMKFRPTDGYLSTIQHVLDDNYNTLNARSVSSYLYEEKETDDTNQNNSSNTVFECGEGWVNNYYEKHPATNDYGSILPSIINFYIAVNAEIFIGASRSSWSNDVWTARYHQGKGDKNYEYSSKGILQLSNDGLPPLHKNCGPPHEGGTKD